MFSFGSAWAAAVLSVRQWGERHVDDGFGVGSAQAVVERISQGRRLLGREFEVGSSPYQWLSGVVW